VDFTNTIVIMTSNVGSRWIKEVGPEDRAPAGDAGAGPHLPPEFLNRIDEVILFGSLTREDLKAIVEIQVRNLQKLLREQQMDVELTDAAKRTWRMRATTRSTARAR
jgi:ATP-dependent Clp protease ATP-binding subunit ClpB